MREDKIIVRALYDCSHARYPAEGEFIICDKGHKLGDGYVNKKRLGGRLVFRVCQLCQDFDSMGEPYDNKEVKEK